MVKIFLSSHGHFASGIKSSCSILLGETDNLTVFDAYVDESSVQQHLDEFYQTVKANDQVLLCSDLYGGSVNQVMYTYLVRPNTRLIAGVNLAFIMSVLVEGDTISDERLDEILNESKEAFRRVELDISIEDEKSDEFF